MGEASRTAEKEVGGRDVSSRLLPLRAGRLAATLGASLEQERALRRPFLWLVVAAGAGVTLYFAAEREPSLARCVIALGAFAILAVAADHPRRSEFFRRRLHRS